MGDFLASIGSGLFIAVASSFLTVHLSLRRFRTERWWDRKAETYSKVVEALYQSRRWTDRHLSEVYGEHEMTEEHKKELLAAAQAASLEIERVSTVGAFLLSEKAMSRLAQYKKDEKHASNTMSWGEHLERDWEAVSTCLTDIIEIAKEDLGVSSKSLWRRSATRMPKGQK